jgi:hypothetical protein
MKLDLVTWVFPKNEIAHINYKLFQIFSFVCANMDNYKFSDVTS